MMTEKEHYRAMFEYVALLEGQRRQKFMGKMAGVAMMWTMFFGICSVMCLLHGWLGWTEGWFGWPEWQRSLPWVIGATGLGVLYLGLMELYERSLWRRRADRVFRQLFDENRDLNPNQPLSNVVNSPRYAPKVFANHPHSEKVSLKQFEAAMLRALLPGGGFEVIDSGKPSNPQWQISKVVPNSP
jgi:hypothetical protein